MNAAAIELSAVTRHYGTSGGAAPVVALDGVDAIVARGEYVAIVGPSGAGKSTLLNILGCLDRPSSGTLSINGRSVSQMSATQIADVRNQEIGFVFQAFNLIPSLTAAANVELPMVYSRVPRADRQRRALEALDRVGLGGRAKHRPHQLSGGQQQRVAVARAVVNDPAFILADEPTGNLDSGSTDDVLDVFDELHAAGTTIVIITHEDEVAARASRVLVMRDGRIAEELHSTRRHLSSRQRQEVSR